MREIDVGEIIKAIEELCIKANKILPDDLCGCISCAEKSETDELPKKIMGTLLENLDAAKELNLPICQDTGMAVIFCDVGQDVHIVGGDFENAVNEGVSRGYTNGLLRTLKDLYACLGDRRTAIIKELTKIHENVERTTLKKACEEYENIPIKGEFVLVIEGAPQAAPEIYTVESAVAKAREFTDGGMSKNEAAKNAAKLTGIKKSDIYKILTEE